MRKVDAAVPHFLRDDSAGFLDRGLARGGKVGQVEADLVDDSSVIKDVEEKAGPAVSTD